MSIFANIVNAEHTFVAYIEKKLTELEKAAPTIEKVTEQAISYAVTALKVVAAQVDPKTAGTLSTISQKLVTLGSVVYDLGAHASLADEFGVIVSDLNSILSLGSIKNANLVGGITKVVQTIATLVAVFAKIAPVVAAA
jgi:hypothetical protein